MKEILLLSDYFFNPYAIPYFLVSVLLLALGIFVYYQNRRSMTHLSYLCVSLSASLWLLTDSIVMSTDSKITADFWSRFVYVGITLIPPSMYFFSSAWLNVLEKKKKWVLFNYFLGIVLIILIFTTDKFVCGYQKHFFGNFSRLGRLGSLYLTYFFGVSFVFFNNLVKDYFHESDAFKKIHKRRIILAFLIAFIGAIDFLPTYGISIYPIGFLSVFLLNIIIAHTIVRYKLMDIETVVHKTIAWFLTSIALITPFVILGYFIRAWYAHLNALGAFLVLGSLALILLFIVKVFQPRIDHLFQRGQYNLEEISNRFTEDLVHLKSLSQIIRSIENTIAETLYSQRIDIFIYNQGKDNYRLANLKDSLKGSLELRSDDQFLQWLVKDNKITHRELVDVDPRYTPIREKAKDYFNLAEAVVAVPLVLNEKLLGIINLGKKANLKPYRAADFHFLTILKNQSTIAISNSLLYENIEEQVRQRTRELVEVQKQLIHAEKLATVGTLAGGVAHEINNPLTAILTNVQMLLVSDSIDINLDRESLELIEEATKRCRTIVQKLMAYAKRPLEPTEVSLVNLLNVVKNVTAFLSYQLEQENIKIITEAKEDGYFVMGNQNELEQVVINMVLNARDAIRQIKKSGVIQISIFKNNDWVNIEIKDEGIGMPKEIIPKIFDPFFTTKEVGRGTGLGLSICQAIIEKHKGLITVQSELKKGSVFTIQLPKVKKEIRVKSEVKI